MRAVEIAYSGDNEMLVAHLWEFGTLGIIENPNELTAFFSEDVNLSALTESYSCRLKQVPESTLTQTSHPCPDCEPVLAGSRFIINSSSTPVLLPSDRIVITIDAQNAFGSGSHESTQLVISVLEEHVRTTSIMLDVGSGSGVLCAVGQSLGAREIFACDTHLDSVLLTRHHAPGVKVFAGSLDSISSNSVDLVVANISAKVIDALWSHLNRVAKPEGLLILSGFIADHPPSSFDPIQEMGMGEWRCWICKPGEPATVMESANTSLQPFPSDWW